MKRSLHRGTVPLESEKLFGRSLADTFDAPDYSCWTYGDDHSPKFAITRLSSGPRDLEQAPSYRPDPAVLICVALTPLLLVSGRRVITGSRSASHRLGLSP